MKPVGIYVCNSKAGCKKIILEITGSTSSTLCSLELNKKEAEKLASDLMNQVIKIVD